MSAASILSPAETALLSNARSRPAAPALTAALERFAHVGAPDRRDEHWKWSNLKSALRTLELDATTYVNAIVGTSKIVSDVRDVRCRVDQSMPALAWAISGPSHVYDVSGDETLTLEIAAHGMGAHDVALIRVPEGQSATVVERYNGGTGLSNVALYYDVGPRAQLNRLVRQCGDERAHLVEQAEGDGLHRICAPAGAPEAVFVSRAEVSLAAGAQFNQSTLAFGAKLARLETHVRHEGEGARAVLDGAYLLEDELHADLTSVVTHAAPGGETRQTVKGAVRDKATGVFQGKFDVARGAQQTDARMGHHALLLSERATVNAKPELEIYADDVQCAHGNTAGALDPEQLFYLAARGLPERQAKALITEAFIAEAFDRVADEAVRETLLGEVRAWLGRSA